MVKLNAILNRGFKSGGGKGNVNLLLNKNFVKAVIGEKQDTESLGMTDYKGTGTVGSVIQSALGKYIVSSSFKYMCKVADNMSTLMAVYNFEYMEITGNLTESMGVAVIGTNKKRNRFTVGRYYAPYRRIFNGKFKATRASLAADEDYNLNLYADYDPVPREGYEYPYAGETNLGAHTFGKNQRKDFIANLRKIEGDAEKSNNLYTVYAFFAMPYAGYVNTKHKGDMVVGLMTALRKAGKEAQIMMSING